MMTTTEIQTALRRCYCLVCARLHTCAGCNHDTDPNPRLLRAERGVEGGGEGMRVIKLSDAETYYWSDYHDQSIILDNVRRILRDGHDGLWLESLTFGLDDQEKPMWYATAHFQGRFPIR